eukprot:SAG31_NODE_8544_length_1432_cov_3.184546_1_plen_63_part_00
MLSMAYANTTAVWGLGALLGFGAQSVIAIAQSLPQIHLRYRPQTHLRYRPQLRQSLPQLHLR